MRSVRAWLEFDTFATIMMLGMWVVRLVACTWVFARLVMCLVPLSILVVRLMWVCALVAWVLVVSPPLLTRACLFLVPSRVPEHIGS